MIKLEHVIYYFNINDILRNLQFNYNLDNTICNKIVFYIIYKTLVDLGYDVKQYDYVIHEIKILLENSKLKFRNEIRFLLNNVYTILDKISFFQNPQHMNKFIYKIDITDTNLIIIGESKG